MSFSVNVEHQAGAVRVALIGTINAEASDQLQHLLGLAGSHCVFDFRDVIYINSTGLRGWIDFFRVFSAGRSVVFEHCSPAVVSQIAMIDTFQRHAVIRSIYGCFRCLKCDTEQVKLYTATAGSQAGAGSPLLCPNCAGEMENMNEEEFDSVFELLS